MALEGKLKGDDTFLASSTLLADETDKDIFGLVVSYSVRVKLLLGAIGGEVTAELPFVLMHPRLVCLSLADHHFSCKTKILKSLTLKTCLSKVSNFR